MSRMSMTVTLDVKGAETTEKVVADGRDFRAYEAEFETSFFGQTTYLQLTQIAFVALRRQKRFRGTWDDFNAQCIELEEQPSDVGEVDPERPTQPDRGDGS